MFLPYLSSSFFDHFDHSDYFSSLRLSVGLCALLSGLSLSPAIAISSGFAQSNLCSTLGIGEFKGELKCTIPIGSEFIFIQEEIENYNSIIQLDIRYSPFGVDPETWATQLLPSGHTGEGNPIFNWGIKTVSINSRTHTNMRALYTDFKMRALEMGSVPIDYLGIYRGRLRVSFSEVEIPTADGYKGPSFIFYHPHTIILNPEKPKVDEGEVPFYSFVFKGIQDASNYTNGIIPISPMLPRNVNFALNPKVSGEIFYDNYHGYLPKVGGGQRTSLYINNGSSLSFESVLDEEENNNSSYSYGPFNYFHIYEESSIRSVKYSPRVHNFNNFWFSGISANRIINDGIVDLLDQRPNRLRFKGDYSGSGAFHLEVDRSTGIADQIIIEDDSVFTGRIFEIPVYVKNINTDPDVDLAIRSTTIGGILGEDKDNIFFILAEDHAKEWDNDQYTIESELIADIRYFHLTEKETNPRTPADSLPQSPAGSLPPQSPADSLPQSPAGSLPPQSPADSLPQSPAGSLPPQSPADSLPQSPAGSLPPQSPADSLPQSPAGSLPPQSPADSLPQSPAGSLPPQSPADSLPQSPAGSLPQSPAGSLPPQSPEQPIEPIQSSAGDTPDEIGNPQIGVIAGSVGMGILNNKSSYGLLPEFSRDFGYMLVGSLTQRVGALRHRGADLSGFRSFPGIDLSGFRPWVRVEGGQFSSPGHLSGISDEGYDQSIFFVQAGLEYVVYSDSSGRLIGSIFGHHGKSLLDFSENSGDLELYGGGASLTWYGRNGFYGDFVGLYAHEEMEFLGADGRSSGDLFSLSGELGYRYALSSFDDWGIYVVPQGQLIWQYNDLGSFRDKDGVFVSYANGTSLRAIAGLAFEGRPLESGLDGDPVVYVKGRLHYDILSGGRSRIGSLSVSGSGGRIEGELSAGGMIDLPIEGLSLHGEFGGRHGFDSKEHSFFGTIGLRYEF